MDDAIKPINNMLAIAKTPYGQVYEILTDFNQNMCSADGLKEFKIQHVFATRKKYSRTKIILIDCGDTKLQ